MSACLAKSEFDAPLFLMLVYESAAAGTLSRSLDDDILSISDGMLVVRAGRATAADDECFLSYGPYGDAKLLYSYGFVCHDPAEEAVAGDNTGAFPYNP